MEHGEIIKIVNTFIGILNIQNVRKGYNSFLFQFEISRSFDNKSYSWH